MDRLVTDNVIYDPENKPAAALDGWIKEIVLGAAWRHDRHISFCLPTQPAALIEEADAQTVAVDHITLRRRICHRLDAPNVDFEVFNFADRASVDLYQGWLATAKAESLRKVRA